MVVAGEPVTSSIPQEIVKMLAFYTGMTRRISRTVLKSRVKINSLLEIHLNFKF
jgi:hypothetical protein